MLRLATLVRDLAMQSVRDVRLSVFLCLSHAYIDSEVTSVLQSCGYSVFAHQNSYPRSQTLADPPPLRGFQTRLVWVTRNLAIADMDVGWIHPLVGLGWVGSKIFQLVLVDWVGFIYAHGNFFVNLTIYIYLSLSTADPTMINVGLLNLFT